MVLAVLLVAFGAGLGGAYVGNRLGDDSPPRRASSAVIDVASAREGPLPPIDVASVAAHIGPSVVTISADVERNSQATSTHGPPIIVRNASSPSSSRPNCAIRTPSGTI